MTRPFHGQALLGGPPIHITVTPIRAPRHFLEPQYLSSVHQSKVQGTQTDPHLALPKPAMQLNIQTFLLAITSMFLPKALLP